MTRRNVCKMRKNDSAMHAYVTSHNVSQRQSYYSLVTSTPSM